MFFLDAGVCYGLTSNCLGDCILLRDCKEIEPVKRERDDGGKVLEAGVEERLT